MFLQKRTRWKWAYPSRYKRAFAFSILPYLPGIVSALRRTYLLQRRNWTGLPRSVQITGWVRCCLYTGRTTSMCLQITCLHPVFLPFWPMCVNNFHIFAHDGTSTTVYIYSPYHPSRHLPECCYPSGNLIPAASHPNVAIDACAGRLPMMEHGIKSL